MAAGLEVKAAAARFYPSLNISAALGLNSFTLGSAFNAPASVIYGAASNVMAPLINRSAIKAAYNGATARQVGAIYTYQQTVLKAYVEVVNQMAQIRNYSQSFNLKSQQVQALYDSISIAGQLFNNARADYTEVLFTQRDALESKLDLIELKQQQLSAYVKAYKALGGGYNRDSGSGNSVMIIPRNPRICPFNDLSMGSARINIKIATKIKKNEMAPLAMFKLVVVDLIFLKNQLFKNNRIIRHNNTIDGSRRDLIMLMMLSIV